MKSLVLKAIQFASKKHKGQTRKFDGSPYVTHPLAVSYLVASYKKSKHLDELLCASLLHDTLEDTETDFVELAKEFTPLVATLVHELTSDEKIIAIVGKREYLKQKMVGISSYALVIKLADRLHNISDNPTPKTCVDTGLIIEHLRKHRKLSKTHKAIIDEIETMLYEMG